MLRSNETRSICVSRFNSQIIKSFRRLDTLTQLNSSETVSPFGTASFRQPGKAMTTPGSCALPCSVLRDASSYKRDVIQRHSIIFAKIPREHMKAPVVRAPCTFLVVAVALWQAAKPRCAGDRVSSSSRGNVRLGGAAQRKNGEIDGTATASNRPHGAYSAISRRSFLNSPSRFSLAISGNGPASPSATGA